MTPIQKISGRLGNQMFQFAYIYSQMRRGHIPDVYVQNPIYFDGIKSEIKELYGKYIPRKNDRIAIHVRRGDYVANNFYVDLMDTDYYQKAMAEFPGKEFIVFSDNPSWCSIQSIFKDCQISMGKSEITDMNLMASCSGHIIANSSYSWWAAYISPYTEKVVAPKAWYTDGVQRTKLPDNWKKI